MSQTRMTPDRFREVLDLMGTTQRGLADLMNWDERLVRRWAAGKVPVAPEVATWLEAQAKLMVEAPQPTPDWFGRPGIGSAGQGCPDPA